MKDYFLRAGRKLKKIGIKREKDMCGLNLMKIICNSIMRILTKLTADLKYEEISKLFFLVQIKMNYSKWLPE